MKLPSLYVECSDEQADLNTDLAKAQGAFLPVVKDEKGPFGLFASLNSMISATRPALAAHGLSVMQPPQPVADGKGKMWCITELRHKSGQWYRCGTECLQFENPQKTMGYFSYMRRLSYGGMLCLASCGDNDGVGLDQEPPNPTVQLALSKIAAATKPDQIEPIISRIQQLSAEGKLTAEQAEEAMNAAVEKRRSLTDAAKKRRKTNAD